MAFNQHQLQPNNNLLPEQQPQSAVPQVQQLSGNMPIANSGLTYQEIVRLNVDNNHRQIYAALATEYNQVFLKELLDFICNRMNNVLHVDPAVGWHTAASPCPFGTDEQEYEAVELKQPPAQVVPSKPQPQPQVQVQQQKVAAVATNVVKSSPQWVDMVSVKPSNDPNLKSSPRRLQVRNSNQPNIVHKNEMVESDLGQTNPGLRPKYSALNVGNVVGNNNYVIVENPPWKTPERPARGIVYQCRSNGLFYTSSGKCIRTDRNGYILTFGSKGNYYVGHWNDSKLRKVRGVPEADLEKLFTSRNELLMKHNLKQVQNPDWKEHSKNKGVPHQITVDKDGKAVSLDAYPDLKEAISQIKLGLRSGKRRTERRQVPNQFRSYSPNKIPPNRRKQLGSWMQNPNLKKKEILEINTLLFADEKDNVHDDGDDNLLQKVRTRGQQQYAVLKIGGLNVPVSREEYESNLTGDLSKLGLNIQLVGDESISHSQVKDSVVDPKLENNNNQ